ncbi:MAG: gliding motility protein GldM, partial [Ferruginibacter sp.]|nr:gliding motility protein GldM [Cytophagales bacterium]
MYLVLTALLALNVSSAILEKFIFLNESMEYSVAEGGKRNQGALDRIKKAVEDSKRAQDMPVLKNAEQVRQMSAGMIKEIDEIKEELIKRSGGRDEKTGHFKSADNQDATAIYLIGGKKNGKAYEMKDKLNTFASELSKYNDTKFNPLALDGSEDPLTKNIPEQRRKDFAELNFAETPMVAALAVLSQKQSEVRRMESQALENLASKVGAGTLKFDKIFATANAESKVVAAGTKYHAQMYIAASSSGITPTMKFNGANIG